MRIPFRDDRAWRPAWPPMVWLVLAGTLLTRTAFFMVWPFIAVILDREFARSASEIGSILGSAFLTSALVGFYSGNLSDRFGRQPIMLAGCLCAVTAYAFLASAQTVAAYAGGALLAGLSRALLEPPGTALIVDNVDDQQARDLALHARYFLINVGGAAGPLVALAWGVSARQPTFWITSAAYGAYGIALLLSYRWPSEHVTSTSNGRAGLLEAVGVLRRDRRFLLLLLAMFLSMSAYAQQESTLIQYISMAGEAGAVTLVTALLTTNGLTIVVFQFPLLRLLARYDLYVRTYLGLVFFAAAFAAYAALPVSGLVPWIVVTWVLSVGEAILFPTLQLQVDRMARPGLKGSYFGAAGLSGLGFGCGPVAGGFLLEHTGGPMTFSLTALSVVACGACYWLAARQPVHGGLAADTDGVLDGQPGCRQPTSGGAARR